MSRVPIATAAGLAFVVGWIAGAAILADHVFGLPVPVQFIYFGVVGFVWVFPVWWLMLWAVHRR